MVLETRNERVRLLKAGVFETAIEKMYVERNGFKIVRANILMEG